MKTSKLVEFLRTKRPKLNNILLGVNLCLVVLLVISNWLPFDDDSFWDESCDEPSPAKPRTMEPEVRSMYDLSATFSFIPSLQRRCSAIRDWEPTESLSDPYEDLSSCKKVFPGLAHLEHGYYLLGSLSLKNRKRDRVFRFSCSDNSNKFEYDDGSCTDPSSCSYQKPNEVVRRTSLPKEASTPIRAFPGPNFLKHLLHYNDVEGINKEVIYELERDQLDALKHAKVTKYLYITRPIQTCQLQRHRPTSFLIQAFQSLDLELESDQSYRDYYAFITRFGTHVLDSQVALGGTFLSLNLRSPPGDFVVRAEGGEPDPRNSVEWSESLIKDPIPLPTFSHYVALPTFIKRYAQISQAKVDNFNELIEHEKIHQMLRQASIAMDIINLNRTFNAFLRNAVKEELRFVCPSSELHLVMSGMGRVGVITCNDHPYWSMEEDRYLMENIHFNLVRGVCTTRGRRYLGACSNPKIVFPGLSNCVRFYKEGDCSGKQSKMVGTNFTAEELEDGMLKFKSFTPC